ncbi:MAG: DUF502 domain-containing protein [Bdellovibrionota bacterium]
MRRHSLDSVPNLGKLLKGHFFAGLLVVIPIGVIAWIAGAMLGILWRVHLWLPDAVKPENFLSDPTMAWGANVAITLGLALLLALGISLLGWVSKQFLGRKLLLIIGSLIQRIPVIRSIYSALDQLLRTLAAGGGSQFSRVVYLEYPRKGIWALAFVTSPAKGTGVPPNHLNVYVPTTPNPTSGFHLLVPESEVRESHLRVEDAFKTILSLGIAQSGEPHP